MADALDRLHGDWTLRDKAEAILEALAFGGECEFVSSPRHCMGSEGQLLLQTVWMTSKRQ